MNKIIKTLLILLLTGLTFISCSDDTSTAPEIQEEAQNLEIKTIDVPEKMKQVQDAKAATTVAWVNAVNSFQAYTLWLQVPQNASLGKTNGDRTYTWSRGGLSLTMYYTETSTNLSWKLILNGTDNELVYNNWMFMEASQSVDKKNGWMKIYKENSTEIESEWTWTTDANGKYTFIMNSNSDSQDKIEIISNPDLSGELYFYKNNIKTSKTIWDKDGNGQWWEYDENGNQINSGSWTANS